VQKRALQLTFICFVAALSFFLSFFFLSFFLSFLFSWSYLLYEVGVHCRCRGLFFNLITLGRTPLDEWLAHGRDLCLTTNNTPKRQTSMPLAKFEPTIPGSERAQTHTLDRAPTGMLLLGYSDVNSNVHCEFQHYIPGVLQTQFLKVSGSITLFNITTASNTSSLLT
jgi:hypothetical protein